MLNERAKSEHFTVRVEEQTAARISRVTAAYGLTDSQLIRQLVRHGLREIEADGLDAVSEPIDEPPTDGAVADGAGAASGSVMGTREIVARHASTDVNLGAIDVESIEWSISDSLPDNFR